MLNALMTATAAMAMSGGGMPGDAADDVALVLGQPMEVVLDAAAFNPETSVARAEAFPMPDGVALQVQVGTQRVEGLDLHGAPLVLFFDEAPLWEGQSEDGFELVHADPAAIADHLRRPDRLPMCGSRQLQTYVPSSLGVRLPVAISLTGGLLFSEGVASDDDGYGDGSSDSEEATEGEDGADQGDSGDGGGDPGDGGGLEECKIEIIEHGDNSWMTHCEPHECDLGGGAVGICAPTPLSQCGCARKPDPEPMPMEIIM